MRIYSSGDCENGISETQYPGKRDIKKILILYNFSGTSTCTVLRQSKYLELDPLKNPGKLTDMVH